MCGEAGGSPSSALGSLDSPAHLEVVCGKWTVDPHLPSVSHPFLRVCTGLGPLKPWHSPPAAPVPVSPVDPPTVGVGMMQSGLCHSFRVSAVVFWPSLQRHMQALPRPTLQNPSPAANWHHLKCICGTERGPKDGGPWESR